MQSSFFLNTQDGFIRFSSEDVYFIEVFGKKAKVTTVLGTYIVSSSLAQLEKEVLPPDIFCRIHRSYIVSLNAINAFNMDEVQVHNRKIPMEKTFRGKLLSNITVIW